MKKFLLLIAALGFLALLAKMAAARKAEWQNLSEAEVRERIDTKLAPRVPDDKRAMIADKAVSRMRERGMFKDEPAPVDTSESEAATG